MIEHWYSALASGERGIKLETDNPTLAIAKLYAARKAAGDPDLDGLSIVRSPTAPNQIWIVKNGSTPDSGAASEAHPESI